MSQCCIFAVLWHDEIQKIADHLQKLNYRILKTETLDALRIALTENPQAIVVCDLIFDGKTTTEIPQTAPNATWIVRLNDLNSWSVIDELCSVYDFTYVLPQNATAAMFAEAILSQDSSHTAPWHTISLAQVAKFMRLKTIYHREKHNHTIYTEDDFECANAARMAETAIATQDSAYEGKARIAESKKVQNAQIQALMAAPDKGWFTQNHFAPLWYRLMSHQKSGTLQLIRQSETCKFTFQNGKITQCTCRDIMRETQILSKDETQQKCLELFSWFEAQYEWHEVPNPTPNAPILNDKDMENCLLSGVFYHLPDAHILPIVQSALPYFLKLNDNRIFGDGFNDIPDADMVINTLMNGESMAKLLNDFGDNPMLHKIIYLLFATDVLDLTA